jgi:hypothetical protein
MGPWERKNQTACLQHALLHAPCMRTFTEGLLNYNSLRYQYPIETARQKALLV